MREIPTALGTKHILPGSDFAVLRSFEIYAHTVAWSGEVGLPVADVEAILERPAPSSVPLG